MVWGRALRSLAIGAIVLLMGLTALPSSSRASTLMVVSLTLTPSHIDDGHTSIFNVTVSGGTAPYNYNWSGLPPSYSWATCLPANVSRLSCSAGDPGTFWIGVNVTDSLGATVAAGPVPLSVAQPFGLSTEHTPWIGTVPLTVTFTVYGIGGTPPYRYSWDFGDGSQTTIGNTTHTYTTAGVYTVYGCTTDSVNVTWCNALEVRALAPLAVTLTAQPADVDVSWVLYLNASASGGLPPWTYSWSSLPPGCISENVSTLRCIPVAAGTYAVRVTVSDSRGKTISTTITILVSPLPGPSGPIDQISPGWILALATILGVGIAAFVLVSWRVRLQRRRP